MNTKNLFHQQGFVAVHNLLSEAEVTAYQNIYEDLLSGKIKSDAHRSDLGSHAEEGEEKQENITQIMFPERLVPTLLRDGIYQEGAQCCTGFTRRGHGAGFW